MRKFQELRLILGDQLNLQHSWFHKVDDQVLFVLMEIRPESEYVKHHIQKIVGIFSAMRAFAKTLVEGGHSVKYYKIGDADNRHSFSENLAALAANHRSESLSYQWPDEYRLDQLFKSIFPKLGIDLKPVSSEHFYTERTELAHFFDGKKKYVMENFYRAMRKKHHVLMDGDQPVTGKWNYDQENRKKIPKDLIPPNPYLPSHDVSEVYEDIISAELPHFGSIAPSAFEWPVTRSESLKLFKYFLDHLFGSFGKYQDAMSQNSWSTFHSRISFSLNTKMISPKEVVEAAEHHWRAHNERIDIAQVEGFIRQILGWREYMRGIYWAHMPDYSKLNYFKASRDLPEYFWTGQTKMNCIAKAVDQSLKHAYAHHIQRLMVTGNFCLMTGIDPDQVDAWYLGIYMDAFEWVEITNTRGMSQFADGGIVGTKPYFSSASYINKMGDYCQHCHYNPKEKFGTTACPFNTLYWNFIDAHEDKLANNPRMGMMYRVWHKYAPEMQEKILQQAHVHLENLESL